MRPPAAWLRRGAVHGAVRGVGCCLVATGLLAAASAPAALARTVGIPGSAIPGSAIPGSGPGSSSPPVTAAAGELINASTGTPLWAKDLGGQRPMGSITKVMTALLVLRAGDLSRPITVTKAAVRYVAKDGASSAGLIAGDVLTARQLLEAMLLPSGCDAAYLLATAYGPGRTSFVAQMNVAAAALGMTGTHFTSFDGMPYPTEHSTYSTPADLITLGEAAMKYRVFRQAVAQRRYSLPRTASHHAYRWQQTNLLIGSYRGALGIKTGDTRAAGNCLLFEARRDGVTLLGVVLHASPTSNPGSAIVAARHLLNWGFAHS